MWFSKKSQSSGSTLTLAITGMHCVSCSISIDGALEDLPGVTSSTTNYAKARTSVLYDPGVVSPDAMVKAIAELGYTATVA